MKLTTPRSVLGMLVRWCLGRRCLTRIPVVHPCTFATETCSSPVLKLPAAPWGRRYTREHSCTSSGCCRDCYLTRKTLQGLASPGALMKGLVQLLLPPPWEAAGKVQSCLPLETATNWTLLKIYFCFTIKLEHLSSPSKAIN